MKWPWQKGFETAQPKRVESNVAQPEPAGWAFLPALQRTISSQDTTMAAPEFGSNLVTVRAPTFLGSMQRALESSAPAGLFDADGGGLPASSNWAVPSNLPASSNLAVAAGRPWRVVPQLQRTRDQDAQTQDDPQVQPLATAATVLGSAGAQQAAPVSAVPVSAAPIGSRPLLEAMIQPAVRELVADAVPLASMPLLGQQNQVAVQRQKGRAAAETPLPSGGSTPHKPRSSAPATEFSVHAVAEAAARVGATEVAIPQPTSSPSNANQLPLQRRAQQMLNRSAVAGSAAVTDSVSAAKPGPLAGRTLGLGAALPTAELPTAELATSKAMPVQRSELPSSGPGVKSSALPLAPVPGGRTVGTHLQNEAVERAQPNLQRQDKSVAEEAAVVVPAQTSTGSTVEVAAAEDLIASTEVESMASENTSIAAARLALAGSTPVQRAAVATMFSTPQPRWAADGVTAQPTLNRIPSDTGSASSTGSASNQGPAATIQSGQVDAAESATRLQRSKKAVTDRLAPQPGMSQLGNVLPRQRLAMPSSTATSAVAPVAGRSELAALAEHRGSATQQSVQRATAMPLPHAGSELVSGPKISGPKLMTSRIESATGATDTAGTMTPTMTLVSPGSVPSDTRDAGVSLPLQRVTAPPETVAVPVDNAASAPTQPDPTQPDPTQPAPTQSAPTQSAPADSSPAHSSPAHSSGSKPEDIEALAGKLFSPLMRRMKAELLLDRERHGRRIDRL